MSRFSMFSIPPVRFGRAPVAPQNRVSASELAAPYQQGIPSGFDHAAHADANMAAVGQYASGLSHQQAYQPYVPHEEQPVVEQIPRQYYQPTPHAQFLANREAAAQALSDRNIRNYDSMGRPVGHVDPVMDDRIRGMVANNLRQQNRSSMTGSQRAFVDNHEQIMANRAMAGPKVPAMTPEQQAFAANWRAANQQRQPYDRVQQAQFDANAERSNLARLRYEQRQRDIRTSRGVALNPSSVASQELLNARAQQKFQNDQQQAAYKDQANHVRSMRDRYALRLIEGQPIGADGKPTAIGGATRAQAIHGYNQYSGMARGDMPEGGQESIHAGQYQDPAIPPQGSTLQRMGQFTEGLIPYGLGTAGFAGGGYVGAKLAARLALGATPWGRAVSFALPFAGSVLGNYGVNELDQATGFSRGVANAIPDEMSGMLLPAAAAAGAYGYMRSPKKLPMTSGNHIVAGQPVVGASPASNLASNLQPFPTPVPRPAPSPAPVPPVSPQPNPWTTATRPAPAPAPAPQNPWTTAMQPGAPRSAPIPQPAPTPVQAPAPAPTPVQAPKATPVSGTPAPRLDRDPGQLKQKTSAPKKSAPPSAVTPNPFAQTPVSQPVSQSLPEVQAVSQPVASATAKTVGKKIAEKDVEKSILNALNMPEAGKPVGRKRTSAAQTTPTEPVPTPGTPEPVATPKLQTPEEVLQELIHGKAPAKRGRTPAKESTAIQPVDAAPVAEVKPKSKTVKPRVKTAAPKEAAPKPEAVPEPAPTKGKKKVSDPAVHTTEGLDKLWNTTEDLRSNTVTRSQAMVHAKKLYTKGVLDDSDMKNLTRMSKDRDLDGEDLLSEMTLAIEHLQSKISQSKLKK